MPFFVDSQKMTHTLRVFYHQRCPEWDAKSMPVVADEDGKPFAYLPVNVGHPGEYDARADQSAHEIAEGVNLLRAVREKCGDVTPADVLVMLALADKYQAMFQGLLAVVGELSASEQQVKAVDAYLQVYDKMKAEIDRLKG